MTREISEGSVLFIVALTDTITTIESTGAVEKEVRRGNTIN